MRNKRGAVRNLALVLGMIICAALVVILLTTIYTMIIHNQVVGQASYIVKNAGNLIEVAYASPETLRTAYDVPIGADGFPSVGSFLLSSDEKEICTHPYSEDEMWMDISNKALTAWGAAVATQTIAKTRKAIREHSENVARREANKIMLEMNRERLLNEIDISNDAAARAGFEPYELLNKQIFDSATDSAKVGDEAASATMGVLSNSDSLETLARLQKEYPELVRNADDAAEFARIVGSEGTGRGIVLRTKFGDPGKALASDPDMFISISTDDTALDFLKNSKGLEKAGVYDDFFTEIGTKTAIVSPAASGAVAKADEAFQVFKVAEGYEMSILLKKRWWKQGKAAEGFRKAVTSADEAAKLHKVAKYNDELITISLLSPGDRYKLMKYAEKTDDTAKIAKLIEGNKKMSNLLGKGDDAVRHAESLVELRKFNPKFYEIWRGPNVARKATGITPGVGRLPGVGTASGVKQAKAANRAVRRNLIKTADDFAGKVAPELTEEAAEEALKPGFWSKMSKRFEGRGIIYELSTKIKDFIDASRARRAAKYAAKAVEAGETRKGLKYAEKAKKLTAKSKVAKELSPEVAELAAKAAKQPKGLLRRAAAKVSEKIAAKVGGKAVGGMKKGVGIATSMLPGAAALDHCVQTSGNPISVGICKAVAMATWAVLVGIDFVTVTLPITGMIHVGHSASKKQLDMKSCYSFTGSKDKIYADPQNCEPDKESLEWEDLGIGQGGLVGMLMGGQTFPFPAPTCTQKTISAGGTTHHVDINDQCLDYGGDCPNIYISDPNEFWGGEDARIEIPGTGISIQQLTSTAILGGATMGCSVVAIASLRLGALCYIGFYARLIQFFQLAPGATSNFMLGSGIFPHTKYYYMAFPTAINVEKEYEPSTGNEWMNVRKEE